MDGLGHMDGAHGVAPVEIGDRPRDAEHLAVRSRGEPEPLDRLHEQGLSRLIGLANALQVARSERGVGALGDESLGNAPSLHGSGANDALAHGLGPLAIASPAKTGHVDRRERDVQIDAIEQWPAQTRAVATNAIEGAKTSPPRVSRKAARAWIDGCDEQRTRWERRAGAGADDGDGAVLERLSKRLENRALELE